MFLLETYLNKAEITPEEDIDRAINRLKDEKFIWAKNIEKYIPKELERKEQIFVVVKMGRKHWKLN